MSGYTDKGLDDFLKRIFEKVENIKSQLENTDEISEEYIKLIKECEQKITDYANILDQRMNLCFKNQNIGNIEQIRNLL